MRFSSRQNEGGIRRWFAWYPVWLSDANEYAWLETVARTVHIAGPHRDFIYSEVKRD